MINTDWQPDEKALLWNGGSKSNMFIIPGDQYWKADCVEQIWTVKFPTQIPQPTRPVWRHGDKCIDKEE